MKLTRFGEAKTIDSFGEIVHADVLGFAAILKEFLRKKIFRNPY